MWHKEVFVSMSYRKKYEYHSLAHKKKRKQGIFVTLLCALNHWQNYFFSFYCNHYTNDCSLSDEKNTLERLFLHCLVWKTKQNRLDSLLPGLSGWKQGLSCLQCRADIHNQTGCCSWRESKTRGQSVCFYTAAKPSPVGNILPVQTIQLASGYWHQGWSWSRMLVLTTYDLGELNISNI